MSEQPRRIQRRRAKGWKMPPNTVYVGRPTKWGNPYLLKHLTREEAVAAFMKLMKGNVWNLPNSHDAKRELRGKNLACWCPLDQPCHADVLLEIANR
jgi:hypothetical protein